MTGEVLHIGDYWRRRLNEAVQKSRTAPSAEARQVHRMMADRYRQLELHWRRHACASAQDDCRAPKQLAA